MSLIQQHPCPHFLAGDLALYIVTPEILRLFIEKIVVGEKSQKYSRTAEQEICIYYRDIGLLDTPVEREDVQEAVPEEYEIMDTGTGPAV